MAASLHTHFVDTLFVWEDSEDMWGFSPATQKLISFLQDNSTKVFSLKFQTQDFMMEGTDLGPVQ